MTADQYRALQGTARAGGKSGAKGAATKLQALGRLKAGEMNKTEERYDQHLKSLLLSGSILWYCFEGIKLRLADHTFLTIDFAVMRADGVLELRDVKGAKAIVSDDARVKMKVAAEAFPFVIKFVYPIPKEQGGGWEEVEV